MKQLVFFLCIVLASCASLTGTHSKSEIRHCQLIQKEFVKKNKAQTKKLEYYLRCSIQDVYIKMCESKVNSRDLKFYLGKSISVKVKMKDGLWDVCEKSQSEAQSRMGTYAIIEEILD